MQTSTPNADTARAPRRAADRRALLRLRDLCDEVLASHRVAHDRNPISEAERREAQAMLATLAPRIAI
ncbi:MAG: hypothetical protein ACYC4J_10285 [Gemmatimonadaceae bacterium]